MYYLNKFRPTMFRLGREYQIVSVERYREGEIFTPQMKYYESSKAIYVGNFQNVLVFSFPQDHYLCSASVFLFSDDSDLCHS